MAALSGPLDRGALERGIAALEARGYRPVVAGNSTADDGLFAGDDEQRLAGLQALLRDADVEAVFFARGGHGVLRLLPALDWELIAARPRWFVGYSDVTPLLDQIVRRCGWIAVHGPMVGVEWAAGLDPAESDTLDAVIGGHWPLEVPLMGASGAWEEVAAPLRGGCLSLLAATLGTPWSFSATRSVLFLEDTGEPLYRIDRLLQQLRLAGALDGVAGVVVGELEASDHPGNGGAVLGVVQEAVGEAVPVAWGCPSGHCRPNHALPLGATATVDADGSSSRLRLTSG